MEVEAIVGIDPRVGVTVHSSDDVAVVLSVPAARRSEVSRGGDEATARSQY